MGKCFLIITIFFLFWSCGYQKAELEKYEDWNCKDFTPCKFSPGWRNNTGNNNTGIKCPADQHDENGKCISNTRECNNKIQNGTGIETWTNGWGICKVNGCDSGFVISVNTCVKESLKCPQDQHEENGKCVSNTRSCKILNGKAEESWINNAWAKCRVKSCDVGFQQNANQCVAIIFPDIKSCKAVNYYGNAKTELNLTDKNWCGDINGRFKLENKGNDFIYDAMLKGYWSKSDGKRYKWADAKAHCTGLGNGYVLPDIYQLLSLISQTNDPNEGYINPIFSNTNTWFWSITPRAASASYAWNVDFGNANIYASSVSYICRVRCFRPGP